MRTDKSCKGGGFRRQRLLVGRSRCVVYVKADGLYLHFAEIELFGNICVRKGLINHGKNLKKISTPLLIKIHSCRIEKPFNLINILYTHMFFFLHPLSTVFTSDVLG